VGEPTRDLRDWQWLWSEDARFPVRSHRGLLGRLLVACKRLLRPLVQVPQNDLWDRQRVFNLILLEHVMQQGERFAAELEQCRERLDRVEALAREGLEEVMRQGDALYSRVDAKLDRYRAETRELIGSVRAALARAEAVAPPGVAPPALAALARAAEEVAYVDFEGRFRGTPAEIARRLEAYLPRLAGQGPVLDLGCGRGEALRVFAAAGLEARGVDGSAEMVAHCRSAGLAVEEADIVAHLAGVPPGSLGAVVSFHVVEHLEPDVVARVLALAATALRPGGLLILETPNPLSLVVGARNFWLDPTHRRPVHPEPLRHLALAVGFDEAEIVLLHPFAGDTLPELATTELPAELRGLADEMNRLRDRLDELLFGYQDYALVARKAG
jgi:O-antigen chain-terminating methyltransferase